LFHSRDPRLRGDRASHLIAASLVLGSDRLYPARKTGVEPRGSLVHELLDGMPIVQWITASDRAPACSFVVDDGQPSSVLAPQSKIQCRK
jgi:hypothetical protein